MFHLLLLAAQPAALPNIEVIGVPPPSLNEAELASAQLQAPGVSDLADLLRTLNGVAAGRMGGHGLEPSIRGQSQTQINVRLDGMEVHGGCPNRMDPPTAVLAPASIDRVVVHKGVQSLRYGPGGSGGAVLVERQLPWDAAFSGRVAAAAGDNAGYGQLAFDGGAGGQRSAWRISAGAEDHQDYRDGDGERVRSAFQRDNASTLFGWRPSEGQQLELGLDHAQTRDALYAGAGMDAPLERLNALRLQHRSELGDGELALRGWRAEVDHVMDNYSLRPLASGAMAMRVPSQADSSGYEALFTASPVRGWTLDLGVQQMQLQRSAIRYAGPAPQQLNMRNALLWPDVRSERLGLFGEAQGELGARDLLTVGLRFDRFRSDARAAEQAVSPMLAAPAAFYRRHYGEQAIANDDQGWGALLRWQHELTAGWAGFAGASRALRVPDATERYIASTAGMVASRWIGNPGLQPERHAQLDAGLVFAGAQDSASAVLFVDRVHDYILRDRARGQDGLLLADGATVYRAVDARLRGIELEWQRRFGAAWRLQGQLAYVHGHNLEDDRALAQIAPLNARLRLSRASGWGEWSLQLRGAARQSRVDADPTRGSGLDAGATPGYGVLDLGWTREFGRHRLSLQLDNLFDRRYAEHLNRANQDPFNPDPVQVNEPGRALSLGWQWRF